jgi:hypothetical protein
MSQSKALHGDNTTGTLQAPSKIATTFDRVPRIRNGPGVLGAPIAGYDKNNNKRNVAEHLSMRDPPIIGVGVDLLFDFPFLFVTD